MEQTIEQVAGKPSDYKICKECGSPNWYENEYCVNGCVKVEKNNFKPIGKGIKKWAKSEYSKDGYGAEYTPSEIDGIYLDV